MPLLIALALLFAAPAAAATCPQQARCAAIRVPLDHTGATPGTLPLAYALLPATGPRAGTIVFLTGGPGEPAVVFTDDVRRELAPLRRMYDIVLVDQRGTGDSGEVECELFGFAGDCAKKLGAKRPFLTTAETARDLEDLRAALGVDRITPIGVSYGTKVAGEYASRFPDRTAALVLDSPVALEPLDIDGLGGIAAMPRVLREVCASGPCAHTVADPAAALFAAVKRVRRRPVRGPQVELRPGGRTEVDTATIGELQVYNAVQFAAVFTPLLADLPAALQSLARGDAAPLIALRNLDVGGVAVDEDELQFSPARYQATICLEGRLPWAPDSALATRQAADDAYVAALGPKPFAPFRAATVRRFGVADACASWPATTAPEPPPAAVPDVPVLVLSGRDDLTTPLEAAQRVASAYPRATLIDVPHAGHSLLSESACARAAVAAFLTGGTAQPCHAVEPQRPASPYVPATLRGERTVAQATVDGVRRQLEADRLLSGPRARVTLPGLRSGATRVTRGRLELRAVEWVRQVRVSGRLSAAGNGRLTLSGAITGTVNFRRFAARRS